MVQPVEGCDARKEWGARMKLGLSNFARGLCITKAMEWMGWRGGGAEALRQVGEQAIVGCRQMERHERKMSL